MLPSLAALMLAATIAGSPTIPADEADLEPAAGLGLASRPTAVSPVRLPGAAEPSLPGTTHMYGLGAAAVALIGAAPVLRRRRDDEPFYVIVHGHGGSPDDFDELLHLMDVDPDRVVAFDYRIAAPGPSSTVVSRTVDAEVAAMALDRLLREVARDHGAVYSIHHSKGAAIGSLAIAAIDAGDRPPIDGYRGAALLDPPLSDGMLGRLQRAGHIAPFIPNNGGFDPIRCDDAGCVDIREHLGDSAGVEVVVIRNPDAEVTSFHDHPDGLRVYDLEYDGGASALAHWWDPIGMFGRVFDAHSSVLSHRAVAECISAEAHDPGSCQWNGSPRPRLWPWGKGGGANLVR